MWILIALFYTHAVILSYLVKVTPERYMPSFYHINTNFQSIKKTHIKSNFASFKLLQLRGQCLTIVILVTIK